MQVAEAGCYEARGSGGQGEGQFGIAASGARELVAARLREPFGTGARPKATLVTKFEFNQLFVSMWAGRCSTPLEATDA